MSVNGTSMRDSGASTLQLWTPDSQQTEAPLFPHAAAGALAILDQGIFAGAHFILNIALARWLSRADYGAFAIAYSTFLLFASLHTAVLTEPMMVFGPGKHDKHFHEYLAVLLRTHFVLMFPVCVLCFVAAILLGKMYSGLVGTAFLGLAVAAPFLLLLWFLRRAFYVHAQQHWSALGGLLYGLLLSAPLYLLWLGRRPASTRMLVALGGALPLVIGMLLWHLNPRRLKIGSILCLVLLLVLGYSGWMKQSSPSMIAFLGMGVAALIVSGFMIAMLKPTWHSSRTKLLTASVIDDHGHYGKWALGTALVSWVPANIYYVILVPWVGLEGTGSLRAIMNLALPFFHIFMALQAVLLMRLVRDRKQSGTIGMVRTVWQYLLLFLAGGAAYGCVLWLLRKPICELLYADKYQLDSPWTIILIGLLSIGTAATSVFAGALKAMERPDCVLWCYIVAGVVVLAGGIPLGAKLGTAGAVGGLVLSSFACGTAMYALFRHGVAQQNCGSLGKYGLVSRIG